jgi:hypothetical protein
MGLARHSLWSFFTQTNGPALMHCLRGNAVAENIPSDFGFASCNLQKTNTKRMWRARRGGAVRECQSGMRVKHAPGGGVEGRGRMNGGGGAVDGEKRAS